MDNINKPITLKCGLTLPNRLAKAAMGEGFGGKDHLPGTKQCLGAYKEWAAGGWGMVMTGNVQVDPKYLGSGEDIAFDPLLSKDKVDSAWKSWAAACSENDTKAIVQINHPGRQSLAGKKGFFEKNVAPSAVPLDLGSGLVAKMASSLLFGTPREMTEAEIHDVVDKFAGTARQVADAGFAGIEIHAAHGYLLAQFLSPKSNRRTDAYGGSAAARAKIVVDIIHAIRKAVPEGFCVGIKLNSADHQKSSVADLSDCIEQIKCIVEAGIDFLEISGGSYENPTMATGLNSEKEQVSASTKAREAYFLEFASSIRSQFPKVPLMVTGGFRTRQGMEAAVAEGHCDMVGMGRPAVLAPRLAREVILNPDVSDEEAKVTAKKVESPALAKFLGIKFVGAGTETMWYAKKIQELGKVVAAKLGL